ncbi:ABC transporter ATP-binding protein [Rhizobium puerariae]|uniref:ABC transporter ATP-binding protein n=1 Tax=Rhizobium puerariae TaxID=1585791 RepID=A0ABV6AEC7_9HYPH
MARLSLTGLAKDYDGNRVIDGIDLDVEDGEFVVFVGPSGCGKSTLLRMIAGLEDISAGTLTIGEQVVNDVPPKDRRIAMVFQSYAIFPHMTVRENVAFGLTIAGASKAEKEAKVTNAARILQMEHLLDRRPSQLSGGQRQRVAIGRAIVRNPEVFLFDEPLSNLDAALRVDMRLEIAKLHRDLKATMLYVTHDQVEAMTLADRIVVLNEGVVQQVGAPLELYHKPANRFVAGFIGSPKMNFFSGRLEAIEGRELELASAALGQVKLIARDANLRVGDELTIGLRPQHFEISGAGGIDATVMLVERLGNETTAVVQLPSGDRATAELPADNPVSIGERLQIRPKVNEAKLFDTFGAAVVLA